MENSIVGIDEAGRGPLAGPVVAAAVVLNPECKIIGLKDSKQLSEKKRESLYLEIKAKALAFAIAEASVAEIDSINILRATLLAMKRAVEKLPFTPGKALVDGRDIPDLTIPAEAIIKGDQSIPEIMAASILAKVYRDEIMLKYDEKYPVYGFKRHKGYGTDMHLKALKNNGVLLIHRKSFKPVSKCLSDD